MTPLLLLPGMMCDERLFLPQINVLKDERPVRVGSLAGASSMEELARNLLADAPERFNLLGLSMGGIVAMEMVRQAPERVARLALLDTNPLDEPIEKQRLRAGQIAEARAGGLRRVMRDEMKPNYLCDGPNKQALLDLCMEMAMDLGPEVFETQSLALRDRPNQIKTLKSYDKPALVLCGRFDIPCPVSRHELMHETLPDSHLEIVEGAGHLTTLEAPEAVNAAIRTWLAR